MFVCFSGAHNANGKRLVPDSAATPIPPWRGTTTSSSSRWGAGPSLCPPASPRRCWWRPISKSGPHLIPQPSKPLNFKSLLKPIFRNKTTWQIETENIKGKFRKMKKKSKNFFKERKGRKRALKERQNLWRSHVKQKGCFQGKTSKRIKPSRKWRFYILFTSPQSMFSPYLIHCSCITILFIHVILKSNFRFKHENKKQK